MARSITIENIGPTALLEIPLADGGGVTVLRGRNDIGKSESLKAVSALAGSGDKLTVRNDAAPGTKGKVSGCGVELTVFKSSRLKGVAEFSVLDGDFSIEDIVDPGVKDPVAADAKRIKALLRVAGAEIPPAEFFPLVGGQEEFIHAVGPDETDPLVVSGRVRAWLHKQATALERESEALSNKAAGIEHAYNGVDLGAESDASQLRSNMEAAIREASIWETRRKQFLEVSGRWESSCAALARAEARVDDNAVDQAAVAMAVLAMTMEDADAKLVVLRAQLEQAEQWAASCRPACEAAVERLRAAEAEAKSLETLRKVVEAGTPVEVTEEDVAKAQAGVDAARVAVEVGAKVRDARGQLIQSAEMKGRSKGLAKEAEACRDKAGMVNAVLNKAVENLGVKLSVQNERLIVTSRGKQKLFDGISVGARRKVALDIAIDRLGPSGLLPLSQEAWEGLDGVARQEVYDHLRERGVNMITAACSTDESIVAEVYTPEE